MYKVGVIGLGFGEKAHIPAFSQNPLTQVTAICSTHPEKMNKVAKLYGIEKCYSDWRQLVQDSDIDIVSIAVSPTLQAMIIPEVIKHSKHLFIEKPMGCGFQRSNQFLQLSQEANVFHAIDFEFSEIPIWQYTKSMMDKNILGPIRHFFLSWHVLTYAFQMGLESWKKNPQEGGGALNLFGSHSLFYLEWFFGPISAIRADLGQEPSSESGVHFSLRFQSGVHGVVDISMNSPCGSGHKLEVYGEQGRLVLCNPTKDYINGFELSMETLKDGPLTLDIPDDCNQSPDGRMHAVSHLVDRFVKGIKERQMIHPNMIDGCRVEFLIDQARESSQLDKWLHI